MAAASHLVGDLKKPCASFLKLPLFTAFADSSRSPRSFSHGGAVGLGIVAAMSAFAGGDDAVDRPAPEALWRWGPISIGSRKTVGQMEDAMETDAELSESYTCVIAHLGGNKTRKRVYYGDRTILVGEEEEDEQEEEKEDCFRTPPAAPDLEAMKMEKMVGSTFEVADFLRRCASCSKDLDGLDIYMYKGEKAFCSEECRCEHVVCEELEEKFGSGTLKTGSIGAPKTEYSASPCSAFFFSGAGVVVA